MYHISRAVLPFILVSAIGLFIGCSEKSTNPETGPPAGSYLWSNHFGDADYQKPSGVAIDASGNVLIAGEHKGTVNFGGGDLASAGDWDVFIAKFTSDSAHVWSKSFGDAQKQYALGFAVDASGDAIVTGELYGDANFGGGVLSSAGSSDIFIAKFDPNGSHLWSKKFGDSQLQEAKAVAVDASGNVFVAGYFQGTVDFGGGNLSSAGGWDIFIAKFAANGTYLWCNKFGDVPDQFAMAVAVDASGNVIVAGHFQGTVNFGGGDLTTAGSYDIFIAKFDANGTYLWSKKFGDSWDQSVEAATVDAFGNVIVVGHFNGTVNFGGGNLSSAGGQDIYIAKFASDGSHLWSKKFGDASDQFAMATAVDAYGNVIVAGDMQGTVNFGGDDLTSADTAKDIFVAKFGSDGSHVWSQRFGGPYDQNAVGVGVDASGNVIVTGFFLDTMDLGGGNITSAGGTDIFILKLLP